ncbi:MAG TPA: hypothetical protein VMS08_01010 [Candidatus Saccharimonadia bacterium]|nr:hypothetical protein [Candidatus Saccharimonadia bacterium]
MAKLIWNRFKPANTNPQSLAEATAGCGHTRFSPQSGKYEKPPKPRRIDPDRPEGREIAARLLK